MHLDEIIRLTDEHGEGWARPHAERLLALIVQVLPAGDYDHTAVEFAAYLHDWAALARWGGATSDHAERSASLARRDVLPLTDLDADRQSLIADAIAHHDYRDTRTPPSIEALLLREVDMLDMLGAIGVAREFSWGPRNLGQVMARIRTKHALIGARLTLVGARSLAADRIETANRILERLEAESQGHL